jgi:ankyrin repeat protein
MQVSKYRYKEYSQQFDKTVPRLCVASYFGLKDIVKLLLEEADVETKSSYGRMALHWAASNGHEAVVKLLLEKGVNVERDFNKV